MLVFETGVGEDFAKVSRDPADGQIHFGQLISRVRLLLTVDGDAFLIAAVILHELDRLDEHAATATTGIVDLAALRLNHFSKLTTHLGNWGRYDDPAQLEAETKKPRTTRSNVGNEEWTILDLNPLLKPESYALLPQKRRQIRRHHLKTTNWLKLSLSGRCFQVI